MNAHMSEWTDEGPKKKWMIKQMSKQADEWHALLSWPPPGIQLEGEEEEPEEEATLGSRLMSLLEKVRLVKKKEKKPEEELPAEESKPGEAWAIREGAGWAVAQTWGLRSVCVGPGWHTAFQSRDMSNLGMMVL